MASAMPICTTTSQPDEPVPENTRRARAGRPRAGRRASVGAVRLQEFWSRLDGHFGSMRARSLTRDHVFAALDGRTAVDAIDAGVPVRKVWLAICEEYDVPPKER